MSAAEPKPARVVSCRPRYLDTPIGPRSFTDISLEIDGEVYGARLHGAFSTQDIRWYAEHATRLVRTAQK